MDLQKLRRTNDTPTRYGTLELRLGDVVDVPAGVAAELLAEKDGGWELAPVPVQTSATSDSPSPRRRKSADDS